MMGQRAKVIAVMSYRAELDRLRGRRWAESRSAGYDAHDGSSRGASMRRRTVGPGWPCTRAHPCQAHQLRVAR